MALVELDTSLSLQGKVSIVTGGASGIGKAIARSFMEKGSKGLVADLRPNTPDIAREFGWTGISIDLTKKESPERVIQETIAAFGKVDILVNCAGIGPLDKAELLSEDKWDDTLLVNLKAPFRLSQEAAKQMIRQNTGGRIINMASQAGIVAIEGHLAYTTSKAGLIGMTKSMAYEWGRYGITVNAVSPTVINTDLSTGGSYWKGDVAKAAIANTPIGRFGEPEEVAALCCYLASNAAGMITGANILIDGGYTIH